MFDDGGAIRFGGLADEVGRRLRNQILSGVLSDGDRIVERDVSEALGLSRGPVREALKQLSLEGLVVLLPRRGARVSALTRPDAEEILALRAAVEPLAVQYFMQRNDPAAFQALQEKLRELGESALAEDGPAVAHLDMEFHGLVYRHSGRRRLLQIWEQLHVPLLQTFWIRNELYESISEVSLKHQQLLDVMRAGNAARAAKLVRAHVLEFQQDFLRAMNVNEPLRASDEAVS